MGILASNTEPIRRIVCLSNGYDQNYHDLRGEEVDRTLSVGKRIDLFQCLKITTGGEVIVLSSPPQAKYRRSARWLPAVQTKLSSIPQFFCCNWDIPKLRIPLSWGFYAWQAIRLTRNGDIILIDNYELTYVIAAYFIKLFHRVTFILDYEDGKHLIDRSWSRILSGIAEWLGRRLIRGAILAHPAMKERLPADLPTILIPGFVTGNGCQREVEIPVEIRFLYSGTLDSTRGVDLLLKTLEKLPESGWHLDFSGAGPLASEVERVIASSSFAGKVVFHKTLPAVDYQKLVASSQVGLNCQRASDPISEVTFPSKIFSYLSAGLMVLSSTGGAVREICGKACIYFEEETPESLAAAMAAIVQDFSAVRQGLDTQEIRERFSPEGSVLRLRQFLETVASPNKLPAHR